MVPGQRRWLHLIGWNIAIATAIRAILAQEAEPQPEPEPFDTSSFIPQTAPYPIFYSAAPRNYNLKWGNITGRLFGSIQTEYNDNINLSQEAPRQDVIISPNFGIGFL